jgi:hypothetical protein
MEEWKAVPGYEDLYYVSNLGRMLVKRRIVTCIRDRKTINI